MMELGNLTTQELVELRAELSQRSDFNAPVIDAIDEELKSLEDRVDFNAPFIDELD